MVVPRGNKIGLIGGIAYTTCTIIGSGIFVSPKGIITHVGSVGLSLLIWILCAGIAMINTFVYIELATSIPTSGGDFNFITYVGWSPLAFAFLWLASLIEGTGSCAVIFMTFGKYIVEALNPLDLDFSTESRLRLEQCLGFAVTMLVAWLNFYAVGKWSSRLQIVMMAMKVLACGIIVGTGFYFLIFKGHSSYFTHGKLFAGSSWKPGDIALAIYAGRWAYSGYDTLCSAVEDIEPERLGWILPRAMLGGLATASSIYVLVNIAYFAILTPNELLNSEAVATSFSQHTLGDFQYAIPAIVGVLMIGTLNSDIFQWSRVTMVGARRGYMPSMLAVTDPESESPRFSVLFHCLVAMGFSFFDVDTLLDYVNVAGMLRMVASYSALIYIKWTNMPVSKKAVKYHIIVPITAWVICSALIIVPFFQDIMESGISCGLVIVSSIGYFIFVRPKRKLGVLRWLDEVSTRFCQRIFWGLVEEEPKDSFEKEFCPLVTEKL